MMAVALSEKSISFVVGIVFQCLCMAPLTVANSSYCPTRLSRTEVTRLVLKRQTKLDPS
jgi:hypothetical protein